MQEHQGQGQGLRMEEPQVKERGQTRLSSS